MDSSVTTLALQGTMSRQQDVLRMAMKLMEKGLENEDAQQKELEHERKEREEAENKIKELDTKLEQTRNEREELQKKVEQQSNEQKEMEVEYKNRIDHLNTKIADMDDLRQSELQRIVHLTEVLIRGSVAMGVERNELKSGIDCDPVTALETELHTFSRLAHHQAASIVPAFREVELGTRQTGSDQVKHTKIHLLKCPNPLEPQPSTSRAANNVTQEPPKKQRKTGSSSPLRVELDEQPPSPSSVKQEQQVLIHRRNPSTEFRGRFVCTCLHKFEKECQLRAHINYHLPVEKNVRCPFITGDIQCGDLFPSTVHLTQHVRLWHGQKETYRRCGFCRAVIKMGDGRLKKHHFDVHNVVLEDDEEDNVALVPAAQDEMNDEQANDLISGGLDDNARDANNDEEWAEDGKVAALDYINI